MGIISCNIIALCRHGPQRVCRGPSPSSPHDGPPPFDHASTSSPPEPSYTTHPPSQVSPFLLIYRLFRLSFVSAVVTAIGTQARAICPLPHRIPSYIFS